MYLEYLENNYIKNDSRYPINLWNYYDKFNNS